MRLLFRSTHRVSMEGGVALHYSAGHFYNVDDEAEAQAMIDAGVAETEEGKAARLEQEEADRKAAIEAAAAPKPEA